MSRAYWPIPQWDLPIRWLQDKILHLKVQSNRSLALVNEIYSVTNNQYTISVVFHFLNYITLSPHTYQSLKYQNEDNSFLKIYHGNY